jgi:hypothetical protein
VNGKQSTVFSVSDLRYGSAIVELEEQISSRYHSRKHTFRSVVESFSELAAVTADSGRPFWITSDVLKKFATMADPLPHGSIAFLETHQRRISVDDELRHRIDDILSPDTTSEGFMTGTLDAINMHGRRHAYLYPLFGHQRVVCDFSAIGDSAVKNALQQRVMVRGSLHRRSGDPFPFAVDAKSFVVIPADSDLPTLRSLRGTLEPSFETSTDEFIESLRNDG